MYECMVTTSAEHGSIGYGCQSCLWSAEQGNTCFPCTRSRLRIWSRQTSSAVTSRVSPLPSSLIIGLNLVISYSRDFSRFQQRRPHIPSTAIGSVPRSSGYTFAYRRRSLPRVRRHTEPVVLKVVPVTGGAFSGVTKERQRDWESCNRTRKRRILRSDPH